MITSFIVYNSILIFATGFAWMSSKTKNKLSSKIFVVLSFLSICIPAVIRYDSGYDYSNYVDIFKYIYFYDTINYGEYSYYIISKLFSFSEKGYIGVMGLYFFIALLFIYKLSNKKYLHYTVFFFITLEYGFFIFDEQIRQVLSMAIFLFTIKFIEKRQLNKFILFNVLSAFFIHKSAFFILPVFFLSKITLSKKRIFIILIIVYISMILDLNHYIVKYIISEVPMYSYYINTRFSFVNSNKLAVIYRSLVYTVLIITIVINRKIIKRNYIVNIVIMGLFLYLISFGNPMIIRVSNYLLLPSIIIIGNVVTKRHITVGILMMFSIIIFERNIKNRVMGGVPYKTIFSDDAKKEYFEPNKD